jgi:hypothetical protein
MATVQVMKEKEESSLQRALYTPAPTLGQEWRRFQRDRDAFFLRRRQIFGIPLPRLQTGRGDWAQFLSSLVDIRQEGDRLPMLL